MSVAARISVHHAFALTTHQGQRGLYLISLIMYKPLANLPALKPQLSVLPQLYHPLPRLVTGDHQTKNPQFTDQLTIPCVTSIFDSTWESWESSTIVIDDEVDTVEVRGVFKAIRAFRLNALLLISLPVGWGACF